jgi:regulatory protein
VAFRYLGRRDRTVAEMRAHLAARGIDPDVVESAIGDLEGQGYLDDAAFAERYAADRRELDGWGSERIESRLRELGVDGGLVARALGTRDADAERDAALALLRRRFPVPPDDDRGRARALGLLVRRGYELELAHDVIRAHERA